MATVRTASTLLWAMKSRTQGKGHSAFLTSVAFVGGDRSLALLYLNSWCVLLSLSFYSNSDVFGTLCKVYVSM